MTWLVAHMWIALAGAALVALLLGWSVRGMLLLGKLRRAEVDRDVARVELGEARDEIERLFASQRKLLSGQGDAQAYEATQASPQADPALEQKLAETVAALQAARTELDELKAAPPMLAPGPDMTTIPAVDGSQLLQVQELENRLAVLETELEEAKGALVAAEIARAEAAASSPPPETDKPADADPKMVWKLGYLTQRVKALEDEVASQPVPVSLPDTAVVEEIHDPAQETQADGQPEPEEELARLRWRNRYLEGRLAYFEGDNESVADEIAAEQMESDEVGASDEAEADDEAYSAQAEETGDEDDYSVDPDAAETEDESGSVAEAILGQLEAEDALADAESPEEAALPVRPLALERPVEGAPDDLTLIGGIGPRIQDVLNSLGIYHYDQIADWTPENVAWIDEYLSFHGRVKREGWVEQAAVLVGEAES